MTYRVFLTISSILCSVSPSFSQSPIRVDTLLRSLFQFEKHQRSEDSLVFSIDTLDISFVDSLYSPLKGITTFRGGPSRNGASYGKISSRPASLKVLWSFNTGSDNVWGGGAGWTGQPCVVQWPDSLRQLMNIGEQFKLDTLFTEIIHPSLDGKIYFLDLSTGLQARNPIDIKNPIKGSPSIDPRGYPLLYCGQGIPNTKEFGFRIFSLLNQEKLFFLNGKDSFAHRGWGAFDGAPLIHAKQDKLFLGGENGLFYSINLNTKWMRDSARIGVLPLVKRYRYKNAFGNLQGMENSVLAYQGKAFFADNNGFIQSLDLKKMSTDWIHFNNDDTDATMVLEVQDKIPYLYTGSEVDIQGAKGFSFIRKINAVNGLTIWEKKIPCFTVRGAHPVNGGMLSTPVIGKMKGKDMLVCSISRYETMNKGLMIAFNKTTGDMMWQHTLTDYAWSSPLDIYDADGNMYIFQADSRGHVMLLDGADGKLIYKEKIADLFEASPVAFNNKIIIASRPRKIFCLEVR
jgi:outer membrane protein assembly factor BamB